MFTRTLGILSAGLAVTAMALPAQDRSVVATVYAGGADHFRTLSEEPRADFKPGFNVGGSLGFQVNKYFGIHGDFTFTRMEAQGASVFAGEDFNRYFYGAHLEGRYPFRFGIAPYVFAGGGAVTVDPQRIDMDRFTKPAAMYGLGLDYAIPGTQIDIFFEAKNFVYSWDRGGFDRTQVDFTYAGGLGYRFPF